MVRQGSSTAADSEDQYQYGFPAVALLSTTGK